MTKLAVLIGMLILHVLFGLLGIAAGATALGAAKGSVLHARSGWIFVGAMLVLAGSGFVLALARSNSFSRLNEVAAALTLYLLLTGFLAIRRAAPATRWLAVGALAGFGIALAGCIFGLAAGERGPGPPAPAYFVFAGVALLAALGDVRTLIGGIQGARRVARHLWRMGAALWIATASFFLGQAKVFPEALRQPALLAIPVLLVLLVVLYWFVRIRLTPAHARARRVIEQASR